MYNNISRRNLLKFAGFAGSLGVLSHPGPFGILNAYAAEHGTLPIGMNLASIADWETGYPFLNLMWGARIWHTKNVSGQGPWNTNKIGEIDLDEDGYPLEIPFRPRSGGPSQYVFTLLPSVLKSGKYVILYDGEGEFRASAGTKIRSVEPGRVEISMTHGGVDQLEILSIRKSKHGNHIRNIRILPIEHEKADLEQNPFRPEVIEFCKPWHCLRFMDWLVTNNSINLKWSDRKKISYYTQTSPETEEIGFNPADIPEWKRKMGSGIAIELCIKLANLTKTDAWLCVPHLADDDYIRNMAQMVREQLDPSLKVYLEYSNEIWNWQFFQTQWMIRSQLAGDLVIAGGGQIPWEGRQKPQKFRAGVAEDIGGDNHPERIGALFRRCFKIWEDVFSDADRKRLVRVCAVQAHWPDTGRRTLEWVMKHGGCDVFSPAGYFGPNEEIYARWEAKGAKLTADDVIKDMRQAVQVEKKVLTENVAIAKAAGVGLAIYEGGQHIQPQGQAEKPYNDALGAVQKHPAMYDLYRQNFDLYVEANCQMFCAFSSVGGQGSRYGSWGHAEYYGQDPKEMPKYRAVLEANKTR